ncbi:trypsin-like peptidase domain-containing protein [Lysinibacillus sp. fls2-241-R2A-57]|uniref:trypsin-like peptidase domain-containing protein n=1 Tax=Lysinibacillus sp. fls2-241-R2A-57 TaxID=3040292 RepID=UPI0025561EEB|nr:trypsin-like peptidase domain-containing protein [Lysinibacillus sp. fls2-241-R2A-57]
MIVTTRPLKIKYKKPDNPLQEFMQNIQSNSSLTKEVVFLRYIGIPDSVDLYKENILKMDEYFYAKKQSVHYLRLHKLEVITNNKDIDRFAELWENWQAAVNNPPILYKTTLCSRLKNDQLEWTKKLSFQEIIHIYKENHPNSNATLLKNFAVKFLYWMDYYLPQIFSEDNQTVQKIVFIGNITQHELLFLYFLSTLGCDICYMNPKEDIPNLPPSIAASSTLFKCRDVYERELVIPKSLPKKSTTPQQTMILPVQSKTTGECSYEQLASLATSVVMIKTFGEDHEVLCYGSGVVLHQDGYILTNLHVVSGGEYYSVLYENDTNEHITHQFVKYHDIHDLAILKVNRRSKALPVKVEGQLVRGQKVVAIGSPLGLFNSVSDGIVSGFRDIRNMSMIQFTAAISNGSSGGALLDMHGRLVGLITAGFNDGQNLNLAVPAHLIYQFAQNFIELPS